MSYPGAPVPYEKRPIGEVPNRVLNAWAKEENERGARAGKELKRRQRLQRKQGKGTKSSAS